MKPIKDQELSKRLKESFRSKKTPSMLEAWKIIRNKVVTEPKIPEFKSDYQELFNHMHDEHGLILLESEMDEIIHIVNKIQK